MAKRIMSSSDDNIIENFPDEVLSHIISFLPIKDAVRTSILSRRWRCLFTFISNLNLKFDAANDEEVIEFMNHVNQVFFFFEKLSILRFRLKCRKGLQPLCINGWIRALVSRNVQELDLCIKDEAFDGLSLPNSLFSCKTLVILKLDVPLQSYDIKVPESVCLPSVKVFHLKGFAFSDDCSSERLFSGCYILEDLVLQSCSLRVGCHIFHVLNSSLKRLTISRMSIWPSVIIELVIKAPRMTYFENSFCEFDSYEFLDVKSLTKAIICHDRECLDVKIAFGLLNVLKNVQSLQISSNILSVLQIWLIRVAMSVDPFFCKMTNLKILNGEIDMYSLIYFLSHTDCLENLTVKGFSAESYFLNPDRVSWACNSLSKLWNHLKEIIILSFEGKEDEMRLVELFLKNALALKKLTLRITTSASRHSKIMKKLLMLRRVSKKCQVVIL